MSIEATKEEWKAKLNQFVNQLAGHYSKQLESLDDQMEHFDNRWYEKLYKIRERVEDSLDKILGFASDYLNAEGCFYETATDMPEYFLKVGDTYWPCGSYLANKDGKEPKQTDVKLEAVPSKPVVALVDTVSVRSEFDKLRKMYRRLLGGKISLERILEGAVDEEEEE